MQTERAFATPVTVRPFFVLLVGVIIGIIIGFTIPMVDAHNGGGTFVPKYEKCR